MKNNIKVSKSVFESIKHIDKDGNEYWLARELQKALEYAQWRRFNEVIDRAIISCDNSKLEINDHFAKVGKMVGIGPKSSRSIDDYKLSRYACYLIDRNLLIDLNKSMKMNILSAPPKCKKR